MFKKNEKIRKFCECCKFSPLKKLLHSGDVKLVKSTPENKFSRTSLSALNKFIRGSIY